MAMIIMLKKRKRNESICPLSALALSSLMSSARDLGHSQFSEALEAALRTEDEFLGGRQHI